MKTAQILFRSKTASVFASVALSALALFGRADGQMVYRHSLAMPDKALTDSFDESAPYNLRLGPVDFSVGVGISLEYNDNVNYAPSERAEEDFILAPFLELDAVWQVSELNTLRLSLGVGYEKYLNNSDLDSQGVLISPNSLLAFRVYVGDFRITLSDWFTYSEDPFDFPTVSDTSIFRRFENQAGIQVDWDLSQIILTGGYTHYNMWTFDEEYADDEHSIDTLYLRPTYQFTPTIAGGVNLSYSWITYATEARGDGTNFLAGPFVDLQITEYTRARLEIGYQQFESDDPADPDSTAYLGEGDSSIYVRGEISNRLNENFDHRLAFSRSTELGIGSESYELNRIEYGCDWRFIKDVSLRPSAFWENYDGGSSLSGNRYGFRVALGYKLTPSVTVGIAYRYIRNDADLADDDYTQNAVTLSAAYQF